MTTLNNYHHFEGLGWSTGYLCNVLAYQGVTAPHTGKPYTEAMLMGINGGICAGYFSFEYEGWEPHLHFLTRYPFDEEPGAVFERLGIPMQVQQTTNPQKASPTSSTRWHRVSLLSSGEMNPVSPTTTCRRGTTSG